MGSILTKLVSTVRCSAEGEHIRHDGCRVTLLVSHQHSHVKNQNHCRSSDESIPVIDFAEPPLHAEIMIRSSMRLSLILLLPLWTM